MSAATISDEEVKRVKALGFLNNKGTDNFSGRVITRNGKLTAAQHRIIADAAEKFGNGIITYTIRQTIEVQGIPFENIEPFREYIKKEGLETGGTGAKVRPVVSCKGTTCHYGLLDSFGLSEKLHNKLFEGYSDIKLPHKFKIAVGGCPNNCVKPDINDVGVVGQLIPNYDAEGCKGCKKCSIEKICPVNACTVVDKKMVIDKNKCLNCGRCVNNCNFDCITSGTYGYKVYIGGRWGKITAQGKPLSKIFTSEEEVIDVIEKLMLFFRDNGQPGERFGETIDRIGFENVEAQIL